VGDGSGVGRLFRCLFAHGKLFQRREFAALELGCLWDKSWIAIWCKRLQANKRSAHGPKCEIVTKSAPIRYPLATASSYRCSRSQNKESDTKGAFIQYSISLHRSPWLQICWRRCFLLPQ